MHGDYLFYDIQREETIRRKGSPMLFSNSNLISLGLATFFNLYF